MAETLKCNDVPAEVRIKYLIRDYKAHENKLQEYIKELKAELHQKTLKCNILTKENKTLRAKICISETEDVTILEDAQSIIKYSELLKKYNALLKRHNQLIDEKFSS